MTTTGCVAHSHHVDDLGLGGHDLDLLDQHRLGAHHQNHGVVGGLQETENESRVVRNFRPLSEGLRRRLLGWRFAALLWLQLDGEDRTEGGSWSHSRHETLSGVETEEEQLQCVRVVDGDSASADQAVGIFYVGVVYLNKFIQFYNAFYFGDR